MSEQIAETITDPTALEGTETEQTPRPRGRPRKNPPTLTALPGQKIKKADEMDVLAASPIPTEAADTENGPLVEAGEIIDAIGAAKSDQKRWNSYSAVQRYALLGAATALQQILGRRDFNGKPASLSQLLGIDIRTHRVIGARSSQDRG